MIKVEIDRATWLHGEGSSCSFLLRESDDKMCCLGFCALALGYEREDILNRQSPANMLRRDKWLKGGGVAKSFDNSTVACHAMDLNDRPFPAGQRYPYEDNREIELKETLKQMGFDVTFIGEYPKPEGFLVP